MAALVPSALPEAEAVREASSNASPTALEAQPPSGKNFEQVVGPLALAQQEETAVQQLAVGEGRALVELLAVGVVGPLRERPARVSLRRGQSGGKRNLVAWR